MSYQCKTYTVELQVAVKKDYSRNEQELLLETIEAINDATDAMVISGVIEEGGE